MDKIEKNEKLEKNILKKKGEVMKHICLSE